MEVFSNGNAILETSKMHLLVKLIPATHELPQKLYISRSYRIHSGRPVYYSGKHQGGGESCRGRGSCRGNLDQVNRLDGSRSNTLLKLELKINGAPARTAIDRGLSKNNALAKSFQK